MSWGVLHVAIAHRCGDTLVDSWHYTTSVYFDLYSERRFRIALCIHSGYWSGNRAVGTCTVVPGGAKFCNIK